MQQGQLWGLNETACELMVSSRKCVSRFSRPNHMWFHITPSTPVFRHLCLAAELTILKMKGNSVSFSFYWIYWGDADQVLIPQHLILYTVLCVHHPNSTLSITMYPLCILFLPHPPSPELFLTKAKMFWCRAGVKRRAFQSFVHPPWPWTPWNTLETLLQVELLHHLSTTVVKVCSFTCAQGEGHIPSQVSS